MENPGSDRSKLGEGTPCGGEGRLLLARIVGIGGVAVIRLSRSQERKDR